jgi:hypothetical protein
MTPQFSNSFQLPDYLEQALVPFWFSGVLSNKFRDSIVSCIIAVNRKEVTEEFVKSLNLLKFLDIEWRNELSIALLRFAEEGFKIKR